MVKSARDVIAPNVKFKPWGAVKFANNVNKGIAGVGIIIEAWNVWKAYKAEKELEQIKLQMKEYLGEYFNALNTFIKGITGEIKKHIVKHVATHPNISSILIIFL